MDRKWMWWSGLALAGVIVALASLGAPVAGITSEKPNPWPPTAQISAQALARELEAGKKPTIVCVGFPILYEAAHIPGARIEGPGRETAGLARLEKWAHSVPHDTPVIIYCGCCPFSECPNIRPAYEALRHAGLTRVRVLYLEHSFARDWVNKGYPTKRPK